MYKFLYHEKLVKLELSKNYDYADMWSATSLLPRYQFEIFYQWIDFSLCPQSTFDNPEWFYRHVDMHGQCTDKEILPNKSEVISCCWKGNLKIQMDKASSKSDILILLFLWTLLYASLWPCAIWNNCLVFNLEGQPCYCSQDQVDRSTSASPSRIIETATAAVDWCCLLLSAAERHCWISSAYALSICSDMEANPTSTITFGPQLAFSL